jgi:hypothetical protein
MSRLHREFSLVDLITVLVAGLFLSTLLARPAWERGATPTRASSTGRHLPALAGPAQSPAPSTGATSVPDAVAPEAAPTGTGEAPPSAGVVPAVSAPGPVLPLPVAPAAPGPVVAPPQWIASALSAPAWSDIAALGQEGAVEVTWQHQARFTSYSVQCTGGSPRPLVAFLVNPASQFWADYGPVYQSMGYDVVSFTAPPDGTDLSQVVRQPGPVDALPFEHSCRVVGYPDVDGPSVYEASNPASATPAPGPDYVPPPAVPTGLAATATGPTTVELAWDRLVPPAGEPFEGYRVYVDGDLVAEVPAGDSSPAYTAGGLVSGVEHTFGVSSFGSAGESEPAGATATPVPVTVASGLQGPADGLRGMAFDGSGNLYVAVPDANAVDRVTPSGIVALLTAEIADPRYVAVDGAGDVYVADGSGAVSKVTPAGAVSDFASGFGDVRALAFDPLGNLYVASASGTVFQVTPTGMVSTVVTGMDDLQTMAADGAGQVYLANSDGTVVKAGGGNHTVVGWAAPVAMTFDPDGNVYLAEANGTVYKVTSDGNTVTAVAAGFDGSVRAVAWSSGFLYVGDAGGTVVKVG